MLLRGKAQRALAMVSLCLCFCLLATGGAKAESGPDFGRELVSADARYAARWALATRDPQGLPFAIVDKKEARLFVFDARGRLVGATAALTGLQAGDHAVAGTGAKPLSQIRPEDRTTPAGRFASEPGRNLEGEDVVWIDYDEGLAVHRLRPTPAGERRAERLASPTPRDNRISFGCVIVPAAFYTAVVAPTLGKSRGVVYVLPESRPVQEMLKAYQAGVDAL